MPAVPAALGIGLGIIAASWGWGLPVAIVALAAFTVCYFRRWHFAAFMPLAAATGAILAMANSPQQPPAEASDRFAQCRGELLSERLGANAQRCVVRVDTVNDAPCVPFKCLVYNKLYDGSLEPGCRVAYSAEIALVRPRNGVPYEAEYDKYLKYDGITAQCVVYNQSLRVCGEPSAWHRFVNNVREGMARGISASPLQPATSAFLLATILGEDDYLRPDIAADFRDSGLGHVLALSGLHVGIIASLLALALFPLRVIRGGRYMQYAITLALIWIYAVVTGLGPSVTRAAVMLTVFIITRILQRPPSSANSLAVALIVVLAMNPYSLFTPGLQMSFAAVAAILLFVRLLPSRLKRNAVLSFAVGLVFTPIAAMLGTGIIAAYYFHQLPLLFLPANMAIAVIFPPLLGVGLVLMLCTMAGAHVVWLGAVADFLYGLIAATASFFSGMASWRGIFFSAWAILPYWVGLVLLAEAIKRYLSDQHEYDKWNQRLLVGWVGCWALSAAIIIVMQKPHPQAELYLPPGNPQGLMLVTPDDAYVIPIGQGVDTRELLNDYDQRFGFYLLSRGHRNFALMPDSALTGPFYRRGRLMTAGHDVLMIADTALLPTLPGRCRWALLGKGYYGNSEQLRQVCGADTVVICSGVNGNYAGSLRRHDTHGTHFIVARDTTLRLLFW